MEKGLVTVVLPIYKVEPYLNRCIESVVNQTYRNLDILLIDDGSPDHCPQICDSWAERDARIRVIHKKNEGLGMARNTGIENAKGEYICFFDSDDYIALDTIESAYSLANKTASEIVIFGFNGVSSSGCVVSSFIPCAEPQTYSGEEVVNAFFPDFIAPSPHEKGPKRFYMSSWVLLYSMEVINRSGWRFVSEREIIAEDVYSMLTLFVHIQKVAVLPKALYYYCENGVSLSRGYRPDRCDRIKHFYVESIKVCRALEYSEEILHRVSKPYLSFLVAALKQECKMSATFPLALAAVKRMAGDEILQEVLHRNKKDVVSASRKILFFALRYRFCFLATALLRLKR